MSAVRTLNPTKLKKYDPLLVSVYGDIKSYVPIIIAIHPVVPEML